jgi:cytoskeletal protein RodZ
MKKIIFFFILVLAIAIISAHKKSAKNEIAEKYAKQATAEASKGINNPDAPGYKESVESLNTKESAEGRPKILIMLNDDTRLTGRSPSLWWSYKNANPEQNGC